MTTLEWAATQTLGASAQRRFVDALPYCTGTSTGLSYTFTDGVPAVRAEVSTEDERTVVSARLDRIVAQAAAIPDRQSTVLLEVGGPTGVPTRPLEQFREVGPGVVVGSPLVATAMNAVDQWALRRPWLAAEPLAVPSMVSLETLERANYVRSFPHHLTGCSIVEPRLEALEDLNANGLAAAQRVAYQLSTLAVTPAACHNVYAYLAGRTLDADRRFSMKASCARHEPSGYTVGRRMWSFTMREFVFAGQATAAKQFATVALERLGESMAATGLPIRVTKANDPFFVARAAGATVFQIAADSKFELAGVLPDGEELAIASVNLHRAHFTETFDIRDATGAPAHTACVAFGLERWAYWLLSHLTPQDISALTGRLHDGVALHADDEDGGQ